MRELTKRQSEIYNYIKQVVQMKGYPPSVRFNKLIHCHNVILPIFAK